MNARVVFRNKLSGATFVTSGEGVERMAGLSLWAVEPSAERLPRPAPPLEADAPHTES